MTLGDMIHEITQHVGSPVATTELIDILNRAMVRIAREAEFPRHTIDVNDINGEFTINDSVFGVNALYAIAAARDDDSGSEIPILSSVEAARKYRGWRTYDASDDVLFLIQDVATSGLGKGTLYPVPTPETTISIVVTVVAQPPAMEEMDDEPFDGLMPEYHEILVHYVVYQLTLRTNDPRRQEHYMLYSELRKLLWSATRPRAVLISNPLYGGQQYGEESGY